MTRHYKNPCARIETFIPVFLIIIAFFIITLSVFRLKENTCRNDKPCCLKGYICKAMMSAKGGLF